MTALTQPCATPSEEGIGRQFPVAAGVKIWQGALVVLVAGGWASPGQSAAGLISVGRARHTVDNTEGANGARSVEVDKGTFRWPMIPPTRSCRPMSAPAPMCSTTTRSPFSPPAARSPA